MPHLTFKIFVAWVELALLIWERYSEINLLIEYHQEGHIWWFGLTAAFLSAPGVLTILLLTYNYKKGWKGSVPSCLPACLVTAIKEGKWMVMIPGRILVGVFFPIAQLLW